jgi:CheY-like chemotaxis protein
VNNVYFVLDVTPHGLEVAMVRLRLLVVEENIHILKYLSSVFKDAKVDFKACASGSEAIRLLGTCSYNALLCNIKMQNTKEFDVLKASWVCSMWIRAIYSGYPPSQYLEKALRHGADVYIEKPKTGDVILQTMQEFLARQGSPTLYLPGNNVKISFENPPVT